jgi:hypothetical protein
MMLCGTMITRLESRDAALLLLRSVQERGERRGKPLTRARVSGVSLKTLWNRQLLPREWLDQVNEWLLAAGWLLVDTGSTYAIVRTSVIENWPRIASKHLESELEKIAKGSFEFESLSALLDRNTWTGEAPARLKTSRESRPTNSKRPSRR